MGMFDTITGIDGLDGQVKCWGNELRQYAIGDTVPEIDGQSDYLLWLYSEEKRGGELVLVLGNKIVGSLPRAVFGAWGDRMSYPAWSRAFEDDDND